MLNNPDVTAPIILNPDTGRSLLLDRLNDYHNRISDLIQYVNRLREHGDSVNDSIIDQLQMWFEGLDRVLRNVSTLLDSSGEFLAHREQFVDIYNRLVELMDVLQPLCVSLGAIT